MLLGTNVSASPWINSTGTPAFRTSSLALHSLIHGEADTFVPSSMAYELYDACKSPKDLVMIPGAGHAEAYYKDTKRYEEAIRAFLSREDER